MSNKFIQLTFHPGCLTNGYVGDTTKKFWLNHTHIEYMVEYNHGTKICLRSGDSIFVNESQSEIIRRIDIA